jgi:tetratricopeptide (TPR) repeat protein
MQRLRGDLGAAGFDVWADDVGLEPGTPAWESEIEGAIEGATSIVVLLSPDAKRSVWVGRELSYGEQHRIPIIPVLVDGDEQTAVPLRLISTQRVDARGAYESGRDALIATLRRYEQSSRADERPAADVLARAQALARAARPREAVELLEPELDPLAARQEWPRLAACALVVGINRLALGRLADTERALREASRASQRGEDAVTTVAAQLELARWRAYEGRGDNSLLAIEQALKQLGADGLEALRARAWCYRAHIVLRNNATPAVEAARRARDLSHGVDHETYAWATVLMADGFLSMAAVAAQRSQNVAQATELLGEAEKLCGAHRIRTLGPEILLARSRAARIQGSPGRAAEHATAALALADAAEYRLAQAEIHNALTRLAMESGEHDKARRHAAAARERALCDGPPHVHHQALAQAERLQGQLGGSV